MISTGTLLMNHRLRISIETAFPASASDVELELLLGKVFAAETGPDRVPSPSDEIWTLHRDLELAGFELMDECDAALATKIFALGTVCKMSSASWVSD